MRLTAKTIDGVKLPPGQKEASKCETQIAGFGLRLPLWIANFDQAAALRIILLLKRSAPRNTA
jgi:hypothetical protein